MLQLLENLLTASFHGSIVIGAVLVLRLVLKKAPRKYICWLWLLAGFRLLLPIEIQSDLSLQPRGIPLQFPAEATALWVGVIALWLVIACCFGVYSFLSYRRLKRRVREAVRVQGGWESEGIDTAFILGFIKPQIYIPMGMDKQDRKYILEHERTHLDKGDHWIKMIGFLALALHWFNPLVWMAYLCLCKDIEMACDERVVQFMELEERKGYSAALLSCSANQVHFASPVAFGEISVKERVMTVLKYKKPGFWVSLISLIAIAFVAVCLLTSPTQQPAESMGESTSPTEPAQEMTLEEQAINKVTRGFQELLDREYYNFSFLIVDSKGGVSKNFQFVKDGENTCWMTHNHVNQDGHLHYEGKDYVIDEAGYWLPGDPPESQLEALLAAFDLEGKELYNTVIESKVTDVRRPHEKVFFVTQWSPEPERLNTQPMTVYFDMEGRMTGATVENIDGKADKYLSFSIGKSEREDIQKIFDYVLTTVRDEAFAEVLNARPSNYSEYDKKFNLGSAQMGWQFMDGEWFFKFGAEDVSETGLKLVVENSLSWGDGTIHTGQVTSAAEYYIERLEGDIWVDVPRITENFAAIAPKKLGSQDTLTIDWTENYGRLSGGFYRIGMYYDFAAGTGETDNKLCYAKFRLYDPVDKDLLENCASGIRQLNTLAHFRMTDHSEALPTVNNLEERYVVRQFWRNGGNWLEATWIIGKEDDQVLRTNGTMVRDGKAYTMTWEDNDPLKAVSSWQANTYVDESNYTILFDDMIWSDAGLLSITGDEKQIVILEKYEYDDVVQKELVYSFDQAGNLTGIVLTYIREDGSRVLEQELTVLEQTEDQIDAFLDSQDVSTPGTFSWAEDKSSLGEKDEAQVGGFVNTTAWQYVDMELVVNLAHEEAPQYKDYPDDFSNVKEVFYDAEAEMWKVSCRFSHDSCLWYDVYIDDQGVTQLMIRREKEPQW